MYRENAQEAVDLGSGRLMWTEKRGGWAVRGLALKFPHEAWGRTPALALDELVRFLRRVVR